MTKRASVIPLVYTPDPRLGRVRARVIATCWDGPHVLYELHENELDPTQDELDAMAATITITSGVAPTVRVIQVVGRPPLRVNPLDDAA